MADKKISELNQVVEVGLTDMLLVVQNGTSKRASAQQLSNLLNTDLTLGELVDVSVSGITDGQTIIYDELSSKYVPSDIPNTTSINNVLDQVIAANASISNVVTSLSNTVASISAVVGSYDSQIAAVSVRVTSVMSGVTNLTSVELAARTSIMVNVNAVSAANGLTNARVTSVDSYYQTVKTSTDASIVSVENHVNTVSTANVVTEARVTSVNNYFLNQVSVLGGSLTSVDSRVTSVVSAKQDNLVSGTNIKTINGDSILGSGNLVVSGGGGGGGSLYLVTSSAAPTVAPVVEVGALDSIALGSNAYVSSLGSNSIAIGHARTVGSNGISIQTLDSSVDEWGAAAAESIVIGPGYVEAGSTGSAVIAGAFGSVLGNSTSCLILGQGSQISSGSESCAIIHSTGAQIGFGGGSEDSSILSSPNSQIGFGGTSSNDTIVGGSSHNIAYSAGSFGGNLILGGSSNTIDDASNCVVVGGSGVIINGAVDGAISLGGGKLSANSMVGFPASNTGQTSLYIQSEVTTDATPTILSTTNPFKIGLGSFYVFKILVGGKSNSPEQAAGYEFTGTIRNFSGTTSLLGSVTKTVLGEDNAAWDCNVTADNTTDTLSITVTGENAVEVLWCASVYVTQVF
jgi:hypothetical protein